MPSIWSTDKQKKLRDGQWNEREEVEDSNGAVINDWKEAKEKTEPC